jgi:hypothetical protein
MATVIDALLVTLGLDPSEYKKGEAEAAKATTQTAAKVTADQKKNAATRKKTEAEQAKHAKQLGDEEKKRADQTVKGFKDIAIGAGALLLGFDSLKGFVTLLGNLNNGEANLGRVASNLGVDAHTLQSFGLAAKRMGGSVEDVQGSVANLSKSLTDLSVKGTVSPLIELMMRLGAQTRGVTDKTKSLLDLGDKLRAYSKEHGRDNAFNLAAEGGINASTFNLITADDAREKIAAAEKQAYADDASIKAAQATQDKLEKLKQRGAAIVADIGHTLVPAVVDTIDQSMTATGYQLHALNAFAHGDLKEGYNAILNSFGHGVVTERPELDAAIERGEDYAGIPRGVLATIAKQESNYDPKFIAGPANSKGAKGLMQLNTHVKGFEDAGQDTFKDIDRAAAELKRLAKHYGGDYVKAAEAYNWGEGNMDNYLSGKGNIDKKTGKRYFTMPEETSKYGAGIAAAVARSEETRKYGAGIAAAVARSNVGATPDASRAKAPGAAATGATANTTNVDIGHVTVNTAATDANGVAAGIAAATKRQVTIANANTGQTQ